MNWMVKYFVVFETPHTRVDNLFVQNKNSRFLFCCCFNCVLQIRLQLPASIGLEMKWEFLWLEASGLWNKNLPFSFGQSFQQSQRYNFKDGVFKYWQFVKVTTNSENSRASKYSLNIFPTIWLVNNLYFPTILCKYLDKFYSKLGLIL